MDGILHQLSVRLSQLIFLAKKWPILSWKWRFFGDFWMIEGIYLLFLYPKWMKIRSIIRVNEDKKKFQTPPTHFLAENCLFLPQKACYFFVAVEGCTWGPSLWGKLMVMNKSWVRILGYGHLKYLEHILIWNKKCTDSYNNFVSKAHEQWL